MPIRTLVPAVAAFPVAGPDSAAGPANGAATVSRFDDDPTRSERLDHDRSHVKFQECDRALVGGEAAAGRRTSAVRP